MNTIPEASLSFARDVYSGHGKFEILPKVRVSNMDQLAAAYTPGVGHVVEELVKNPGALYEQSGKDNLIALVTNGTAVLGYGNVGPHAAVPVMEGKAVMFKMLAGIDCMPLCLNQSDPDALVDTVLSLEPTFGAFNLEDIRAPECFHISRRLEEESSVAVLHDDQYGTATVIIAGLINACKVLNRELDSQRIIVLGCGAAGTACIRMLAELGVKDIVAVDRDGILERDRKYSQRHWNEIAESTNPEQLTGNLATAIRGRDVFIGLSGPNLISMECIKSMAADPVVFSLANPEPEILPDAAKAAGAAVTASGRFDYPNHCNNVLAFPALFRAALDTRARSISVGMCVAAARAIADCVPMPRLSPTYILPNILEDSLYPQVAEAVACQAVQENLARINPGVGAVAAHTQNLLEQLELRQTSLPASP